jgi:hypothetical protein
VGSGCTMTEDVKIPTGFVPVLRTIADRLSGMREVWALTGSLGLRLQGVPLEVHDIDLQTTRVGAFEVEQNLESYIVQPVSFFEGGRIRSYFGRLELGGVEVEVMGDLQKKLPDGRWDQPPDLEVLLSTVAWQGRTIPVLDLVYELEAYRILGRQRTAKRIARRLTSARRGFEGGERQ